MGKSKTPPEEKKEEPKPKPKRKRLIFMVVGVLLLAGLGVGGWFGYQAYMVKGYPKTVMAHVDLDDAVLKFTWKEMPGIYDRLGRLNGEIELILGEMDRIVKVQKRYPRQTKIVESEKKKWNRTVKRLQKQLQKYMTQTEALYVTSRVNPEKGSTALMEKGPALLEAMDQTLDALFEVTAPIKEQNAQPTGTLARLKARLLSFF